VKPFPSELVSDVNEIKHSLAVQRTPLAGKLAALSEIPRRTLVEPLQMDRLQKDVRNQKYEQLLFGIQIGTLSPVGGASCDQRMLLLWVKGGGVLCITNSYTPTRPW